MFSWLQYNVIQVALNTCKPQSGKQVFNGAALPLHQLNVIKLNFLLTISNYRICNTVRRNWYLILYFRHKRKQLSVLSRLLIYLFSCDTGVINISLPKSWSRPTEDRIKTVLQAVWNYQNQVSDLHTRSVSVYVCRFSLNFMKFVYLYICITDNFWSARFKGLNSFTPRTTFEFFSAQNTTTSAKQCTSNLHQVLACFHNCSLIILSFIVD